MKTYKAPLPGNEDRQYPVMAPSSPARSATQLAYSSDSLDDLPGADAGGANTQGFPGSVNHRMNTAEIGIPSAPGDIVSMAHIISVRRTLAANFAVTRH